MPAFQRNAGIQLYKLMTYYPAYYRAPRVNASYHYNIVLLASQNSRKVLITRYSIPVCWLSLEALIPRLYHGNYTYLGIGIIRLPDSKPCSQRPLIRYRSNVGHMLNHRYSCALYSSNNNTMQRLTRDLCSC